MGLPGLAIIVYTVGLMTHVGDDSIAEDVKKHVVIVADQTPTHHLPFIIVLDEENAALIPLRKGDRISLEGLEGAGAIADRDFTTYTPSLAEPITRGLLHDEAKHNTKHDDIFASMTYPAGNLKIAAYHTNKARFVRNGVTVRQQCVPSAVSFEPSTNGTAVLVVSNEPDEVPIIVTLGESAVILLLNPPYSTGDVSDAEAADHFANYLAVLRRRGLFVGRDLAVAGDSHEMCGKPTFQDLPIFSLLEGRIQMLRQAGKGPSEHGRHGVSTGPLIDLLLHIFLASNPACTNTDWP